VDSHPEPDESIQHYFLEPILCHVVLSDVFLSRFPNVMLGKSLLSRMPLNVLLTSTSMFSSNAARNDVMISTRSGDKLYSLTWSSFSSVCPVK
jgi:hypothetical protein